MRVAVKNSNMNSRVQPNSPYLVQVHTNLPPGIDAPPTAFLNLSISLFRATQSVISGKRRGQSRKPPDELSVRVRWWGEPTTGECAVFNPRLAHKVGHKQITATRARYRITVPLERFSAYLKDMRALYFDVLDDAFARAVGRARLDRIDRLTVNNSLDTILTVINDIGEKIGDLTVSISIEPVSVSARANRENYRSENDVDSRVTCPGSPKLPAPVSDISQNLRHSKSDNREECDEVLNRHSRFSTSDRGMLDPTNEHAVDADYDHSAAPSPVGDFVRAETISHEKPPLPQSSKQSVDFGSTEGLSADDLHCKHVFMNEDDIMSEEFNRTIRINNGGIERSAARPKYVSNGIKPAYTDKAPIGSHSPVVSRSPSTPDLRNPQNRLNQFVDLGNRRSMSEQYLQMDLLPVRNLGSASRKPSDQSIVIGRVDPAFAPLTFPTDAAFVEAVDDLPDCSDEDSQSDSPMECLIRNDNLLEELFFNNSNRTNRTRRSPRRNTIMKELDTRQVGQSGSLLQCSTEPKMNASYPDTVGPESMILQGVRLYTRCLQMTSECYENYVQAQTGNDRLVVRPGVINLNTRNRLSGIRSGKRASPSSSGSKSRSGSQPRESVRHSRSRSASPQLRHSGSAKKHKSETLIALTLEVSVPIDMETEVSIPINWITTSQEFHLVRSSSRSRQVPDFVGSGRKHRSVRFMPLHRTMLKPIAQLTMPGISGRSMDAPTDQYTRFRLFTRSFGEVTGRVPATPQLIALNNVSMDELKTAILTKNHWRSSPRARLFVHLFTPGSGPHNSPDDVNFLRMSSGLVRARLEMEVEPIWKIPSKQPTGSFGSRSVAEPLTKPVTLSAHPLPIRKPVHSVQRQNPCPTHTSNLAPIALETLLSIPQGRRLRLSGIETNDDSGRRPTNRSQTVNSIPTSAHAYNTSDSVRTVTFGKTTVEHTYLIVRLPWCQTISADTNTKVPKESTDPASSVQSCRFNSAVAWMGGSCPSYKFALRTPCVLDAEMLGRLAHSFAVIEVWVKMTSGQPDSLLGLAKISTDAFAATFACVDARTGTVSLHSDEILTALRNSLRPAIVFDTWQPVVDPFSGVEHGQLRVRLAVGTSLQIESLQFAGDLSTVEDGPHSSRERGSNWQALDLIQWPESRSNHDQNGNQYVEHTLSITIERLFEFDPHVALLSDSKCSGSVPWGDCDCFVQYFFPTSTQCMALSRHRTPVQLLMASTLETLTNAQQSVPRSPLVSCDFCTSTRPNMTGIANKSKSDLNRGLSYWTRNHQLSFCLRQTSGRSSWPDSHQGSSEIVTMAQHHGFVQWLLNVLSQDWSEEAQTSWPRGIPLELWLRIYSPNLRDCLVARGWITEEILTQLIRQTSSSDVDAQIRCAIPLRDVKMERVNGRLDVRLTYSARYVDPPPAVLNTPADATHFGAENQSVPSLLKNDSTPGVRLVVQVGRCTGLVNLVEMRRGEPVTGSGLVRVHCLLLAPTDTYSVGRDGVRSFVLGSASSAPGYDLRVCHQPGITMEVLLPVSWHTLSTSGQASRKEWSLVELLLNGLETQADQFMRRRTNKWSLMIQVDLWLQGPSGPDILSLEWNDLASTDLTRVFHPGPGYRLLGSTRIPLADLIFSQRAHMSGRWYPLCKFFHGQSFAMGETEARIGGRFVGGIEVTAQLSDENRAKRHLMRYVARNFSRDSKTVQCLRRWRVPLPVLATGNEEDIPTMEVDEEPYLWHNGTDEYGFSYKHITIHLDALHMPCAELLLQNDIDVGEGDSVNNRSCHPRASALTAQFTPYVFVRFHFFRHGTQTSRLVAAPRLDSTSSGVVHIDDRKEFTIRVSSAFRAYLVQTELELQVWMLWTSRTADELIEIGPPKDQCAYSDPIRLGCDPPSPRHIGSVRIPLAHLLYSASSENANDESFSGVNPGRGPAGPSTTVTSIRGDPSGLAWWWCESTGQTTGCGGQSHPVFPLYRADTTDLHNAWLAIRLEMCGSRTQMGTHCFGDAASGIEELPTNNTIATGRLGWNLFGLTTANRGLIETVQAGSEPGITEADISEQEADERGTFPAEVVVEQAYHLRINSPNELTKSTRSVCAIVSTEAPSESSVFVTFAVDGDRAGTLSSHDGLWPRIAQSHVERRHSRVAVTPKMPNTDSVCWNYHRFVRLPLWLVQKYSHRSMVFHVWYQRGSLTSENNSDKKPDPEDPEQPELIGLASVDLTSLSSLFGPTAPGGYATNGGLDQVYGWYHVIDQSGLQRGQILLGVKPLIPGLRDEWSSKPIQQGSTEFLNLPMDRLNIAGSDLVDRFSPLSHMRNLLQSAPILSASYPNILETSPPRQPNLKIPLFDSGGTDQTPCEMSRSMLFSSLRTQLEELDAINARFKQRLVGGIFTAEQNIEQPITVPAPENVPQPNSPQVSQASLDPTRNILTSEAKSQFHSPPRPKGGILPFRPILSNTQMNQRWSKGTRSTTIKVAGEFHATFEPNRSLLSCQASNSASQDEQQQSAENPSFGDISYQDRRTDVKCSEITGQPESPSCSPVIPEVLQPGTRSVTPSEPSVMGRATPQPDLDMQSFSSDRESHLSGCDDCVVHEGHLEPDTFVRHNYYDTELISQDRDIHPSVEFDHTLDIDEEEVQDTESESCEISPLSGIPSGSTEKEESKSVRPDSVMNSVQTADHLNTPIPRPEVGMAAVDMDNAVEHSCRSWSPSELSDDFEKFTESNENKPCLGFEQVVSSEVVKPPETSNVLGTSRSPYEDRICVRSNAAGLMTRTETQSEIPTKWNEPVTTMPNFFPPASSIANFMLTGPTGLDERAIRLRELRMGKLQFPEPALETPSLKSEGEDLRKRLNDRISQAISQLHTDLEPITARQNEIQTNATEDPLGTLLAGYRAQSLKNAERVFSSKS